VPYSPEALSCPDTESGVRARPFSHLEPGTSEATWLLDNRWDDVPRLALDEVVRRYPKVVLAAPHPDDECLALGATLHDLAQASVDVTIVVATHGGVNAARRFEGERAIAALSPHISTVWWDLPDGDLSDAEQDMRRRLAELVDDTTLLLAPVENDGHTDHEAVSRAAAAVATDRGAALLLYPVWLWHWATPRDVEWTRVRSLAPSLSALQAKRAAIDCHRSQLVVDDGHPIVGAALLDRARRVTETVLVPRANPLADRVAHARTGGRRLEAVAQPFDAMYEGDDDPWQLDSSHYERRRLQLILACLGRDRYGRVLEIGCATGQLSSRLRNRADEVVGLDASAAALRVARERCATVRWVHGAAPQDIPDEEFDLIVVSELGYFLDGVDLLTTLRGLRTRLRAGGELVIANWCGPTEDIPLDGETVQQQAVATLDLPVRARYRDADLVIDVWGEPISVHAEESR
jgi:LmbE family N-acetylglucosaminyl deacetylase/SAM-dependent methyltransferase